MWRLRKFLSLPASRQLMLVEAGFELVRACFVLRLLPWRVASRGLLQFPGREDARIAEGIGAAVETVARVAAWNPTCLRRAIAAQRMLRRRGLAGKVTIDLHTASVESLAHAGVVSGSVPVLL